MRLASLGSGSKGNATLLDIGGTTIMIDCGFSLKTTIARLSSLGLDASDLDAVLVTHEHSDHIQGVERLVSKYDIPVYMTAGTFNAWKKKGQVMPTLIHAGERFTIGALDVCPVAVPHDAREPVQFVLRQETTKVGVLTDLGTVTPHVVQQYADCHALFVEANHDLEMLNSGPYPPSLKRRVSGEWGHLNNQQSADLVRQVIKNGVLKHLVVGHISQKNNHSELAAQAMDSVVASLQQVRYATQEEPLDWVDIR